MEIVEQPWFSTIRRPSRYIGREINIIKKNPEDIELTVALAFPDVYEVGMSHLGLRILYHILNAEKWLAAERVFAPWPDMEKMMRAHQIPLSTLETSTPLGDCDIVGFSLQHELCYTNVLNMLDLGGIPLTSKERHKTFPLIIAGGPACFNPEPVAEFFDFMVIGDGEEIFPEICNKLRIAKKYGWNLSKKQLLAELRNLRGVYIPSYFSPTYYNDGTIRSIDSIDPAYQKVEKAIIASIEHYPAPSPQIVPFTELIHDRLAVEIARGCGRGCRFCQAGIIYRPVREKALEKILWEAEQGLKDTGYEDISLLSLSTGDYTCIESLLQILMNKQEEDKVAISLPSLRIDSLNTTFLEQIKRVRKTGFTLAVEAGNSRMRSIINKGLTQDEILKMAEIVYGSGWHLIKLYFMIGLPFETLPDVDDIVGLAREVIGVRRGKGRQNRLNVSVATFVPKSHTPFEWATQLHLEEAKRRIKHIHGKLKEKAIRVKWNQPEMSWLEGIFSRGDRRLASVVKRAWELGARFDAWGEYFSQDLWEKSFHDTDIDPAFYLYRKRDLNEIFPWDHISSGVTKEFLKQEWKKAGESSLTPDCRVKCSDCGVCDHKKITLTVASKKSCLGTKKPNKTTPSAVSVKKYRVNFSKLGPMRFLSHRELARLIIRALRRAHIPLAYSKGFHPSPRVSFASALPVGTETLKDTFDVQVTKPLDPQASMKKINTQLPEGIRVLQIFEVPLETRAPIIKEAAFVFVLKETSPILQKQVSNFIESKDFIVTKQTKRGSQSLDLKKLVKSIEICDSTSIRLTLDYQSGPQLRPEEVVKAVFSFDDTQIQGARICKLGQILLD